MDAVIRPADPGDVAAFQAIEVDAGERFRPLGFDAIADDDPPAASELLDHIATGRAWAATVDGQVVGYATASIVDGEGHLDQVSVAVGAAGHGVGRRLIDHVLAWSAQLGHHAVTLTTFRDVPFNGPYYARLGFVEIPDAALGPELAAIRAHERATIEVAPRIAMRRISGGSGRFSAAEHGCHGI